MKKLMFLCILITLAACRSYRVDVAHLKIGMSKATVEQMFGPPRKILAVSKTEFGDQEILEYKTYRSEVYAVEFLDDKLVSYGFIHDEAAYGHVPYPVYPVVDPPYLPNPHPAPHLPIVRPPTPVKPTPRPPVVSVRPDRPGSSINAARPSTRPGSTVNTARPGGRQESDVSSVRPGNNRADNSGSNRPAINSPSGTGRPQRDRDTQVSRRPSENTSSSESTSEPNRRRPR